MGIATGCGDDPPTFIVTWSPGTCGAGECCSGTACPYSDTPIGYGITGLWMAGLRSGSVSAAVPYRCRLAAAFPWKIVQACKHQPVLEAWTSSTCPVIAKNAIFKYTDIRRPWVILETLDVILYCIGQDICKFISKVVTMHRMAAVNS